MQICLNTYLNSLLHEYSPTLITYISKNHYAMHSLLLYITMLGFHSSLLSVLCTQCFDL